MAALRWPDRRLPIEYVVGHRLVGHLGTVGLFRGVAQDEVGETELQEGFFGPGAVAFLSYLLAGEPTRGSKELGKLMEKETEEGYQSSLMTKGACDRRYGIGNWRPMPLFIHEEDGGKLRLLAHGKAGCHNGATSEEETLVVIGGQLCCGSPPVLV